MIKLVSFIAFTVLLGILACGGESRQVSIETETEGHLMVDDLQLNLTGATGTLLNTPNPIHWQGIPMPALLQIRLFDESVPIDQRGMVQGSGQPAVSFIVPAGPDGDFFQNRWIIPAALEITAGGIRTFPSEETTPTFRVRLSDNPLLSSTISFQVDFQFYKGETFYKCDCQGSIMAHTSATYDSGDLPGYPPSPLPDTLTFTTPDSTFVPRQVIAVEETVNDVDLYSVFAFAEPFTGPDPRKSGQTYFSFTLPVESAMGEAVPVEVRGQIVAGQDTLRYLSGYPFGYASIEEKNGEVTGRLHFQNNGSQTAVLFHGGGLFRANIK